MSLKADIITKIAKHERIRFIAKFLKNFNNMEFIKDVNNIYNNRTLYKIIQRGDKEKGKVLYLINEIHGNIILNSLLALVWKLMNRVIELQK